ncbi:hypothetical protein [Nocardia sp. NPDC004722]
MGVDQVGRREIVVAAGVVMAAAACTSQRAASPPAASTTPPAATTTGPFFWPRGPAAGDGRIPAAWICQFLVGGQRPAACDSLAGQ